MLDIANGLGRVCLLMFACVAPLSAEEQPVKKLILPGESFLLEGRPAFSLWPPEEKRHKPQPWIMYAPTLASCPDRHEKWMHEQFLAAGVAVAGIDVGEAYGSPRGQGLMTALYTELTEKRGFAARPCLLGRSRGGLWVSSWAIAHPDKVAGIAGIYPVFDLRGYPGLARAAPAYGMTAQELEAGLTNHNPIARIDVLAEAKVPVCIIHGDDDKVVPLKENSAVLVERYRQAGAANAVKLIIAEGQGHNFWEGFFRCREVIDFAIRQAKADAEAEKVEDEHPVDDSQSLEHRRLGRQPNTSYRSIGNGPLPLVADFVKKSTILDISNTGRLGRQPGTDRRLVGELPLGTPNPIPLVAQLREETDNASEPWHRRREEQ